MIYFLGIGPGDSELLTVKGARILKEADIVYIPQSDKKVSVAEEIIAPYVTAEQKKLVHIPMLADRVEIEKVYEQIAIDMMAESNAGKDVAFVTLGDSMLYSTARYIANYVQRDGVNHEFIAGVPSYIAAANRMKICLGDLQERYILTPMPDEIETLETISQNVNVLVILKVGKRLPVLLDYIKKHAPKEAGLVHRLNLDGEEVFNLLDNGNLPAEVGYLSLAIVRL